MDHSSRLHELSERLAAIYKKNPKTDSVWIGGSVSRGWQDQYSDIELYVCWKGEPNEEDRLQPVLMVQGEIIEFHDYEDGEWSETYFADETKMEISHFLTSAVSSALNDLTASFSTSPDQQCLASALFYGKPLEGHRTFHYLRNQVTHYPAALKDAMILKNLELGNRWKNRGPLAAREDWLMLCQLMAATENKLMSVLFALNEMYIHHPAYKWQRNSLNEMNIKPYDAAGRMESVFLEHPAKGLILLEGLLEDVYKLVQKECPHLNLQKIKKSNSLERYRAKGEETPNRFRSRS
ncbi:DUF4037 domain-containing protein [Metabacillus sp. 113a]|uniref:DUF4037 domain-containing protein n=1 Tax=Metabacillus sp. 113a TaxID=3404706 RepID=UPI003CF14A81